MKKNVLVAICMLAAGSVSAQHLVVGNHDVVRLGEYPQDAYLVEADAESFYRVSGAFSTSSDHPLLTEALNLDFRSIYFIKYDKDGIPLKSNYIRGTNYFQYAGSFEGGLTLMSGSNMEVHADGSLIPVPVASMVEFIATYDPDCQLQKIISIWGLTDNQYMESRATLDPEDGSVYVYGMAYEPVELLDFGTMARDLQTPNSYFYLIKYDRNLVLQWVYEIGFDTAQSGPSPSFDRIEVFPGERGGVLITGTYAAESSPLIDGRSLPPYLDSNGTFAVMLDGTGQKRWVLDGMLKGSGYPSRIFKAFPLHGGDFVLAGNTSTGYFKLGQAEFSFASPSVNNQFVFRIDPAGNPVWLRQYDSQGPVQEGKKKSAASSVFDNNVYYDAILWKNRLLYLTAPFANPAFSVAGESKTLTYPSGIYVAALDLRDGKDLWAYALSSNDARIHGFDLDRSGNVSLMGYNFATQDMDGLASSAIVDGNFLFHLGIDYNGLPLWYNNASLANPPYSDLIGVDLEVLPNGQVFSSMKLSATNEMVIGDERINESVSVNSSWLLKLDSDVQLGGTVTDANENPVYPGYVKAIKSAWWGIYPQVDSVLINDDGTYMFDGLYPGNYSLLAVPDPLYYPEAIPTYYGNLTRWQVTPFHDLYPRFNSNIVDIKLVEKALFTELDGSGEMSGTISLEEGVDNALKGVSARPSPKSSVILLKKAKKSTMSGEVVAYVETDEFGMFTFTNVPDGDYWLHVEVAGLDMLEIHEVTIVGNQIVSGLNYTIGEDGIYIGYPTGTSLLENESLRIYPNPGPGLIMMDLPSAGNYAVRIYAMDGRTVLEEQFVSSGGARTINLSEAGDGIYILRVVGPDTDKTVKYVKK
jgi:hypothetical protein